MLVSYRRNDIDEKNLDIQTIIEIPSLDKSLINPIKEIQEARGRKIAFLSTSKKAVYEGENEIGFKTKYFFHNLL